MPRPVLPDVRGPHPCHVALPERFARAGLAAVAFDCSGRTAGTCDSTSTRAADFQVEPHVERTTGEGIDAGLTAAPAYLRELAFTYRVPARR